MSVVYENKLTVGWRVKQDDIPDYDERWECGWYELDELAKRAEKLLGRNIHYEDLCAEENSWTGDTQIVGVPMFDHAYLIDEFVDMTNVLAELAKDVYRTVMRREPNVGPYLISWTQAS